MFADKPPFDPTKSFLIEGTIVPSVEADVAYKLAASIFMELNGADRKQIAKKKVGFTYDNEISYPTHFYLAVDVTQESTVCALTFYKQEISAYVAVTPFFDTGAGDSTPFLKFRRGMTYDLGEIRVRAHMQEQELLAVDGDNLAGGFNRNQHGMTISRNPLLTMDSDGDGTPDGGGDLDDDNDGTPDKAEVGAAIYDPALPGKPSPSPSPTPASPTPRPTTSPTPRPTTSPTLALTPSPTPTAAGPTEPPKGSDGSEDVGDGGGGHD